MRNFFIMILFRIVFLTNLIFLFLPFKVLANQTLVILAPISTIGEVSQATKTILFTRLQTLLSEHYQILSQKRLEEAKKGAQENLQDENCTQINCLLFLQRYLKVNHLFLFQIVADETLTQLSLSLYRNEEKRVVDTICENCSGSQLYGKINSLVQKLIEVDSKKNQISPASFKLSIQVNPSNAKIRFLDTDLRYREGIKLKPGSYRIEVSKKGYLPSTFSIRIQERDVIRKIRLQKKIKNVWFGVFRKDSKKYAYEITNHFEDFNARIHAQWKDDYLPISIAFGNDQWIGVFQKSNSNHSYTVNYNVKDFRKSIAKYWDQDFLGIGWIITSVSYANGIWIGNFEKKFTLGNSWIYKNKIEKFNHAILDKRSHDSDLLSAAFGEGKWFGVFQDVMNSENVHFYEKNLNDLKKSIRRYFKKGYKPSSIVYGKGRWFGVFKKDARVHEYSISTQISELEKKIQKYDSKGFRLILVAYGTE